MTAPIPADNPWTADANEIINGDTGAVLQVYTSESGSSHVDARKWAAALNDVARLEAHAVELRAELDYARSRAEESLAESAQLTLDAEARAETAETALAVAHNVIRRYDNGWENQLLASGRVVRFTWWVRDGTTEPMAPAEADAIRAALADVPDQPNPTRGDAEPRPTPCQSLRFMRGEAVRCGQPEDGDAHDPLGPPDAHPYDPLPLDVPDQPNPQDYGIRGYWGTADESSPTVPAEAETYRELTDAEQAAEDATWD